MYLIDLIFNQENVVLFHKIKFFESVNCLEIKNRRGIHKMFSLFLERHGYVTNIWKIFSLEKMKHHKGRKLDGERTFSMENKAN